MVAPGQALYVNIDDIKKPSGTVYTKTPSGTYTPEGQLSSGGLDSSKKAKSRNRNSNSAREVERINEAIRRDAEQQRIREEAERQARIEAETQRVLQQKEMSEQQKQKIIQDSIAQQSAKVVGGYYVDPSSGFGYSSAEDLTRTKGYTRTATPSDIQSGNVYRPYTEDQYESPSGETVSSGVDLTSRGYTKVQPFNVIFGDEGYKEYVADAQAKQREYERIQQVAPKKSYLNPSSGESYLEPQQIEIGSFKTSTTPISYYVEPVSGLAIENIADYYENLGIPTTTKQQSIGSTQEFMQVITEPKTYDLGGLRGLLEQGTFGKHRGLVVGKTFMTTESGGVTTAEDLVIGLVGLPKAGAVAVAKYGITKTALGLGVIAYRKPITEGYSKGFEATMSYVERSIGLPSGKGSGFSASGIPSQVARGGVMLGSFSALPGLGLAFGSELVVGLYTNPLETAKGLKDYALEQPYELAVLTSGGYIKKGVKERLKARELNVKYSTYKIFKDYNLPLAEFKQKYGYFEPKLSYTEVLKQLEEGARTKSRGGSLFDGKVKVSPGGDIVLVKEPKGILIDRNLKKIAGLPRLSRPATEYLQQRYILEQKVKQYALKRGTELKSVSDTLREKNPVKYSSLDSDFAISQTQLILKDGVFFEFDNPIQKTISVSPKGGVKEQLRVRKVSVNQGPFEQSWTIKRLDESVFSDTNVLKVRRGGKLSLQDAKAKVRLDVESYLKEKVRKGELKYIEPATLEALQMEGFISGGQPTGKVGFLRDYFPTFTKKELVELNIPEGFKNIKTPEMVIPRGIRLKRPDLYKITLAHELIHSRQPRFLKMTKLFDKLPERLKPKEIQAYAFEKYRARKGFKEKIDIQKIVKGKEDLTPLVDVDLLLNQKKLMSDVRLFEEGAKGPYSKGADASYKNVKGFFKQEKGYREGLTSGEGNSAVFFPFSSKGRYRVGEGFIERVNPKMPKKGVTGDLIEPVEITLYNPRTGQVSKVIKVVQEYSREITSAPKVVLSKAEFNKLKTARQLPFDVPKKGWLELGKEYEVSYLFPSPKKSYRAKADLFGNYQNIQATEFGSFTRVSEFSNLPGTPKPTRAFSKPIDKIIKEMYGDDVSVTEIKKLDGTSNIASNNQMLSIANVQNLVSNPITASARSSTVIPKFKKSSLFGEEELGSSRLGSLGTESREVALSRVLPSEINILKERLPLETAFIRPLVSKRSNALVQPLVKASARSTIRPTALVQPQVQPLIQPQIQPQVQPLVKASVRALVEVNIKPSLKPIIRPGQRETKRFNIDLQEKKRGSILDSSPEYNLFVKRRGKFSPIKGGLTRGEALKLGEDIVSKDLSRTFKIKKTGKKVERFSIEKDSMFSEPDMFRQYKVRGKKVISTPDEFIQRQRFALSSSGEKRDIQIARRKSLQLNNLINM